MVGHMLFTAYTGSEIGITKIRGGGFWPKGYVVAVLLHGFSNTIAVFAVVGGTLRGFGTSFVVLIANTMIFRHRLRVTRQIDMEEAPRVTKEIPIRKRPLDVTVLGF